MKNRFLYLALAPVLGFMACEKKVSPDEVHDTLSTGTWNVSFYSIDGAPSFVFGNYDFTFASDGTASAQGDGTHVHGEWSVSEIDHDNVLDLYLGHSSPFDQLDNDWEINSFSSTRIETENDDNGTVYLTFEKN